MGMKKEKEIANMGVEKYSREECILGNTTTNKDKKNVNFFYKMGTQFYLSLNDRFYIF